jgi:tRNA (guanosine-2'-O-)-methyltransferase
MSDSGLFEYLKQFVTPARLQRFEEVISHRTRHVTVVLENIYQSHNASAVLRSCDCFGIQDVHIIENSNPYQVNEEIALGSEKWLSLYHYSSEKNNTVSCLEQLKKKGYKIVATTPHKDDFLISNIPLEDKIAVVFGTELTGITKDVENLADYFVKIPMFGFTESFNISVSAAIAMYELSKRLFCSEIKWQLSDADQEIILIEWLKNSIKSSDQLVKKFLL